MRHKIILCFVFSVIMCVLCIITINNNYKNISEYESEEQKPSLTVKKTRNKNIACYFEPSSEISIESLQEEDLRDPSKIDKQIFFLETSCSADEVIKLNPRQACAIESAAKMNPDMIINLLILSPYNFSDSAKNLVNQLRTYKNINIRRIFLDDYMKNTPLEEWWASGIFETSQWPIEHMADVLRFLTLWKFPGMYFDLDVVVTSSVEDLKDFSGAEDGQVVAIGVMHFGPSEVSRSILNKYLDDIRKNFQGSSWRHNGPDLLTEILTEICGTKNTLEMTKERCSGFTVHPPSVFYPIFYSEWPKYFETDGKEETMKRIQNSRAIHVWNKLSYLRPVNVGDDVPYATIASQYCPKVYHNCGKVF